MSEIELKPCPFCGGKAGLYHTYDGLSCVQCDECGISTLRKMDARLAIQMWNKRNSEIEWIPVSEKLPEPESEVLVTVRDKTTDDLSVWCGVRYDKGWELSRFDDYLDTRYTDDLEVTAWAHLPEAYKEGAD